MIGQRELTDSSDVWLCNSKEGFKIGHNFIPSETGLKITLMIYLGMQFKLKMKKSTLFMV